MSKKKGAAKAPEPMYGIQTRSGTRILERAAKVSHKDGAVVLTDAAGKVVFFAPPGEVHWVRAYDPRKEHRALPEPFGRDGDAFVAMCSCGWRGMGTTEEGARDLMREHLTWFKALPADDPGPIEVAR